MATDRSLIQERIPERLRKVDLVRNALERLTSNGKASVADVVVLALDRTSAIELRLDAVAALMAEEKGEEEIVRKLLESDDPMIVIETLKIIRRLAPEWAI